MIYLIIITEYFVAASATTLSFAILGMQVFRQSLLASVWSLLAVGIFLNTFGISIITILKYLDFIRELIG